MFARATAASSLLAASLVACVPEVAGAQAFVSYTTDCTGLQATTVAGYPSHPYQTYQFSGGCKLIGHNGSTSKTVHTFPATAYAIWDGSKNELRETFDILGGFELAGKVIGGRVRSTFQCSGPPVVGAASSSVAGKAKYAACNGTHHDNATGLDALSGAYAEHRPIVQGKVSAHQAQQLSANAPPPKSNADAPPPPAPKPGPKLVVIPVPTGESSPPPPPPPPPPVTRGVTSQGNAARPVAPPPSPRPAVGAQPLRAGTELPLADGNVLTVRSMDGGLRWVVADPRGRVLRVFPSGTTATTDRGGKVSVSLGRQVTEVGRLRPEGS